MGRRRASADDGSSAYLQAGEPLAAIDGSGTMYPLSDALGSVRGLTDAYGDLTGTADHDVFGEVRSSNGASGIFGFTGEQYDAESGFTYLRARYLSPGLSPQLNGAL